MRAAGNLLTILHHDLLQWVLLPTGVVIHVQTCVSQHWNSAQYFRTSSHAPDDTNPVAVLWSNAVTQSCIFACYAKRSTEYWRCIGSPVVVFWNTLREFFGHCSESQKKTGLASEVSKSMDDVSVLNISVFYSVQSLRKSLDFEEIEALKAHHE